MPAEAPITENRANRAEIRERLGLGLHRPLVVGF